MPTLEAEIDARLAQRGAREFDQATDRMERGAEGAERSVDGLDRSTDRIGRTATSAAVPIGALAAAFVAFEAAESAVTRLAGFERGLIGVGKTADLAGPALFDLGDGVRNLSLIVPATTEELLQIAQAAGQLGVKGRDDILAFTETVAKLGGASDLAGEEAAQTLARLLNITGEQAGEVTRLGSVIVALGNSQAATESQIARSASEIAKSTAAFEVSSAEAAGLGAALAALGVQAELGGTAVGRTFRAIDAAIRGAGPALEQLEQLTGLGSEQLEISFRSSPVEVFRELVRGLGELNDAGGDTTAALEGIGLSGERLLAVLPTLAQGYGVLTSSLRTARTEVEAATALDKESAASTESLAAQWVLLGNAVDGSVTQFVKATGPLSKAVGLAKDAVVELAGLDSSSGDASLGVEVLAASVGSLAGALAGLSTGVGVAALARIPALLGAIGAINPFTGLAIGAGALAGLFLAVRDNAREVDEELQALLNTGERLNSQFERLGQIQVALERAERTGNLERQLELEKQAAAEIERLADFLSGPATTDLVSLTAIAQSGFDSGILDRIFDAGRQDLSQRFSGIAIELASQIQSDIYSVFGRAERALDLESVQEFIELAEQLERGFGTLAIDASQIVPSSELNAIREIVELGREFQEIIEESSQGRFGPDVDPTTFRAAFGSSAVRLLPEAVESLKEFEQARRAGFEGIEVGAISKEALLSELEELEGESAARIKAASDAMEAAASEGGDVVGNRLAEAVITQLEDRLVVGSAQVESAVTGLLENLRFESSIAGLGDGLAAEARAAREALLAGEEDGRPFLAAAAGAAKAVELTRQRIEAEQDLARAIEVRDKAAADADADKLLGAQIKDEAATLKKSLEFETELLGKSRAEREQLILQRRVSALAAEAEAEELFGVAAAIREEEAAILSLLGRLQEGERLEEIGRQLGSGLAGAFTRFADDAIEDLDRVEDAAEDFARRLRQLFLDIFVFQPLESGLTSLFQDFLLSFGQGVGGAAGGGTSGGGGGILPPGAGGGPVLPPGAGGGPSAPPGGVPTKSLPGPELPPGFPTAPGFTGSGQGAGGGGTTIINVNVNQSFAPGTDRGVTELAAQQVGRRVRKVARGGR